MKTLLSLASVLVLSAAPAMAGDGHVSSQSLAKMGLSGMQSMTDAQGSQIRGLSIAVAAGGSIAFLGVPGGGAASVNTYFAAGSRARVATTSASRSAALPPTMVSSSSAWPLAVRRARRPSSSVSRVRSVI